MSCLLTLCLPLQVAGWPGHLLSADPHRDFLLPGLTVWRVRLRQACYPDHPRLCLQHGRRLPHGVSACSSLSVAVGMQGRDWVLTLVLHKPSALWAMYTGFQLPGREEERSCYDWTFLDLGTLVKHKH